MDDPYERDLDAHIDALLNQPPYVVPQRPSSVFVHMVGGGAGVHGGAGGSSPQGGGGGGGAGIVQVPGSNPYMNTVITTTPQPVFDDLRMHRALLEVQSSWLYRLLPKALREEIDNLTGANL